MNPSTHTSNRLGWLWLLWFVGLVAIVLLSFAAHANPYFPIDVALTRALQAYRSPVLDETAFGIDWFGYVPQIFVLVSLCALMLWVAGRRWEGVWLMLGLSTEGTIAQGVKLLVQRPRPAAEAGIAVLRHHGDATYPSGHVFCYVVVFGLLLYYAYRYIKPTVWHTLALVVLTVFTLLAGVVRMYLGAHWFSDVMAGYLLGALWLPICILTYNWVILRFRPMPGQRASPAPG